MKIKDFKFDTYSQLPLPADGELIQYIRFSHGNLLTIPAMNIKTIIPYPSRKGGQILFHSGATDFYYAIWPLKIV